MAITRHWVLRVVLLAGACLVVTPSAAQQVTVGISGTGAVRFTDASALTCDATTEGSIRYEDASNRVEFCDDTVWTVLGPGAAASLVFSGLTNAAANNTVTNASYNQIWNWQLSGDEHALTIGETAASTGGANQILLVAKTLAASTAVPFAIENLGNNVSFAVSDVAADPTPFVIDANGNVGISTVTPHGALELGGDGDGAVGAASLTLGRGGDIGFNSYEAGGPVDRYLYTTGSAFKFWQDTGNDVLVFKAGGSGTAGNDITYANAMTIGSGGNVRVGGGSGAVGTGPLVVTPPATETIAAAGTITVNACGTIKPIQSTGSVTTNTTNTFTAPAAGNSGCCMVVTNVDTADTITLDVNANFITGAGTDIAVGPGDGVQVCSNGTTWYQGNALSSLASSGSSIDGLSDATYDTGADHNMRLGSNTAMTVGAAGNLFIGESAGSAGTSNAADNNLAIGYTALDSLTTGNQNTAIGRNALTAVTTAALNVAIGYNALAANTGDSNVAIGPTALDSNVGGYENIGIGDEALTANTNGYSNVAIGYRANYASGGSGYQNVVIGTNAARNLGGNGSVAIGYAAMVSGSSNDAVAIGRNALDNATGNNNIAIGYQAGNLLTSGASNIIIGYDADAPANNTSSFLNIGDSIYGDLANDRIRIGGSGTVAAGPLYAVPPATETIAGAAVITANACGTIKPIQSTGSVTTNTTNTFTGSTVAGCCMDVINVDAADTITLDANGAFKTIGGADQALGPEDTVRVCSNGTNWYQMGAVSGNQ